MYISYACVYVYTCMLDGSCVQRVHIHTALNQCWAKNKNSNAEQQQQQQSDIKKIASTIRFVYHYGTMIRYLPSIPSSSSSCFCVCIPCAPYTFYTHRDTQTYTHIHVRLNCMCSCCLTAITRCGIVIIVVAAAAVATPNKIGLLLCVADS